MSDFYFTASFNDLLALNFGALEAGIGIFSLVAGLMPIRAGRSVTSNFPKPAISAFPPSANTAAISSNTVSTATVAFFLLVFSFSATLSTNAFLLII